MIQQPKGRDLESTELEPISLGMASMKELMEEWLVQMADFFADDKSEVDEEREV